MERTKFHFAIEHLWGLIILAGIFIFINTHPIRPYDFWWHITIGKEILSTKTIPTIDIYSFTQAGQPYPSYQMYWLMEVVLYSVYRVGGSALVVFFQSLLVTTAYGILFWISKRVSNSWRIAAISIIFAAALGMNDWNVRPQAITFLLASLILMAIYEYRTKPKWGWLILIPVCILVWVNSHGTFVIGIALIGIWWGQEIWTMLWKLIRHENNIEKKAVLIPGAVFLISALLCFVNPRGIGILDYLRTLTGNSVVQQLVTEWAAPTFSTLMGSLYLVGLIGSGLLLIISSRRPTFFQVVTFLVFGILGIKTLRGSVWFGLVMAPIVAEHLVSFTAKFRKAGLEHGNKPGSRFLNYLIASLVLFMVVITLPWFKEYLPLPTAKSGLISSETPVEATKALLELAPPGELFNSMSFGSYLIWSAYPQYQVFVDSRIELFPENVWLDYLRVSNAEGDWEKMLSDYGVNTMMLNQFEQTKLVNAAVESNYWKILYQDNLAILLVRK